MMFLPRRHNRRRMVSFCQIFETDVPAASRSKQKEPQLEFEGKTLPRHIQVSGMKTERFSVHPACL
jgi:hypothetical protein